MRRPVPDDRRCAALCKDGSSCPNWAIPGSDPPRCRSHRPDWDAFCPISYRCTGTRTDGSSCKSWAVRGSQPPRCSVHGGGKGDVAAKGNQYNLKHGYYAKSPLPKDGSIDSLIESAYQRHVRLNRYIDRVLQSGNPSVREMINLFRLHGQSTGRLGRLLRQRRALAQAVDELST